LKLSIPLIYTIVLLVLVVLAIGAAWQLWQGTKWLRKHLFPSGSHRRPLLEKSFAYYCALSPAERRRFERRIGEFLEDKEFMARGDLPITEEMKTLVAACAVQLTFGLPPVRLRHFRQIILYPEAYFSTVDRRYHQGEVNAAGAIVLSWKHFMEGYRVPNDARNVGLHEMAHALLLENRTRYDGEYDFLDQQSLDYFLECAEVEHARMQRGEPGLLRNYAHTSPAEFFSVAVEVFFENPATMAREAPQLYGALKDLLNQDPARRAATRPSGT
jgi:Mlc titration factor MtfA (ptsG expression regulator)